MSALEAQALVNLRLRCEEFYYLEAQWLDDGNFESWTSVLHPNIDYRVPVRVTCDSRAGAGFSDKAFFMQEDFESLRSRVQRFRSPHAWSENPRTRTRRSVTNVRATLTAQDEVKVLTNVAIFCHRGDAPHPMVLTMERHDVLRTDTAVWQILSRTVLLDTTVLGLESLSIFL